MPSQPPPAPAATAARDYGGACRWVFLRPEPVTDALEPPDNATLGHITLFGGDRATFVPVAPDVNVGDTVAVFYPGIENDDGDMEPGWLRAVVKERPYMGSRRRAHRCKVHFELDGDSELSLHPDTYLTSDAIGGKPRVEVWVKIADPEPAAAPAAS
jgi:hypothetical protein